MPKTIKTKDGIILNNVPDNVTDDEIKARIQAIRSGGAPQTTPTRMDMSNVSRPDGSAYDPYNPTVGMGAAQKFLAGAGKAMADIGRGARQMVGMVSDEDIAASRERDRPLMGTGAGMAGNIVGNVASFLPTAMIPGANTYTGAALFGSTLGALQPTVEGESRLQNAAIGGAGGVAGQGLANALSRVLAPQTSAAARTLMREGVTPTPGQIAGGPFQKMESAMESIPFLGQGITKAKERAAQQYNVAALNRVLAPIGKSVQKAGYEGLEQARTLASSSYDDALSLIKRVDIDPQFTSAVSTARSMTSTIPADMKKQFNNILREDLFSRMTPAKTMSGQSYKTAYSQLMKKGTGYSKSLDFNQQQLGDALKSIAGEMKNLAARTDPAAAKMISNADEAWSMLLRVENAAGRTGAVEGVFSPSQLGAASRQMDSSLRKIGTTQGNAVMQDFANAGRSVLGETLPNSGTADRALSSAMVLGGGYMIDPTLAASIVAGRAAYTPTGQKALAAALAKRTPAMRASGDVLRRLAPAAALGGSAMAVQQ